LSKKKATTKIPPVSSAKGKLGSGSPMDVDLLEQIVKLMSANDLNTVDVRDGEKRVILKRGAVQQMVHYSPAPTGLAASTASSSSHQPAAPSTPAPPAAPPEDSTLIPIKSPMVGTLYAAPTPEAKPFVHVGSAVNEETDVCVIEAMKVFNNIKAETRGIVARVLVANGQTVEFGQTLFLVKP
jgi:acetyl-CoA carboxylase biotin carboxyl carrier protein